MNVHGVFNKVGQNVGRLGLVVVLLMVIMMQTNFNFEGLHVFGKKMPPQATVKLLVVHRNGDVSTHGRHRVVRDESTVWTATGNLTNKTSYLDRLVTNINSSNQFVMPAKQEYGQPIITKTQTERQPKDVSCDQENRQSLLRESCDYYRRKGEPSTLPGQYKHDYTYYMILVDDVHKVLYCEVPKVACTSWKVFLANLSGKVEPKDYDRLHELVHDTTYYPKVGFKYLKDYSETERMYRLSNYFKFLVVRNPIARLVSAYENKLVKVTDQSKFYQDNVGTYIIKKYRQNPSNESMTDGMDATLEELVKLILDKDEMFRYRFDAHWWKMQSICYPCLINYDYIAKLETIEQDLNYLLNKISPGTRSRFPYLNSNSGKRDQITISKYFNDLSEDLQQKIQSFYEIDSKMFGYTLDDNFAECH